MKEFYICKHCGNLIEMVEKSGVPIKCCGENMTRLEPNTSGAAVEKHMPAVKKENNKILVEVGSVEHPMAAEHLINWIVLETKQGAQKKVLAAGAAPKAEFEVPAGDEAVAVYAYCNLHGLWKAEV